MKLSKIEEQWIEENVLMLSKVFPKTSKEKLKKIVTNELEKNIKKETVELHDTYRNKVYKSDTIQVTEFINSTHALTAGNGVLFDRDANNPSINMLNKIGNNRNSIKAQMKKTDPNIFEFKMLDLKQGNEKNKVNAWYGINGAKSSIFFNLFCATGVTLKGRELISSATVAFDSFLGDNCRFFDMNDCIIYIKNIIKEKRVYKDEDYIDVNVPIKALRDRLESMFYNKYDCNKILITKILRNLTQEDINRIYYKNNLEAFSINENIRKMWIDIVTCVDVYVNPAENKTPEVLRNKLNSFWKILEEFVLYNHMQTDRVVRVTTRERKAVLVIDTDSNMIHIGHWLEFMGNIIVPKEIQMTKNRDDYQYVVIYTMCFLLSKMIKTTLDKYLRYCNVKEENLHILDMKNEYLFLSMLITAVKKNYASIIKYKEGIDMGGVMDIKGLPINKSSCNRVAAARFSSILENDILQAKKIDVVGILIKLHDFQKEIKLSLQNGESTFLKPSKIKAIEAYDDPLKIGGFRGAMVWNMLNPKNEIVPNDGFFLVKLTLVKEEQLSDIDDEFVRETLRENIFHNSEKRIRSKGCYLLAIPSGEAIPDWARPFVDEDQIVEDTMKAFMGVVRALGLSTISKSANSEQFSNYISI